MGMQSCLGREIARQLQAAVLDLKSNGAGRRRIAAGSAVAGKDRHRLIVLTDREGSMAVTRVIFRGEHEWHCILRLKDGALDVRTACGGLFLRRAGSADVARHLKYVTEMVTGKRFRARLMEGRADD